ncbi:MAG: Putative polymerase [Thermoanaerobacterales bacterium 50_218]|nr:MAG: Putative polymerase [Thermoanaerobacterales bacterium 50_218]HAA90269.1 hypothetical protein [Peptococcaceae bacterium]
MVVGEENFEKKREEREQCLKVLQLLRFADDGVYLRAPRNGEEGVTLAEIEQALQVLGVTNVDWEGLKNALEQKFEEIKIAPPQPGPQIDGEVLVQVSGDEMEAAVAVYPPLGGKPVDSDLLKEELKKAGVVFGIDHEKIKEAVEPDNLGRPVVVARGKPPVDGKDAEITYHFPVEGPSLKPVERENGKVDYYNLRLVFNVEKGQILATKVPATPGEPGVTVTGKQLPPRPGRDKPLRPGRNTELTDEGGVLIATSPGHVVMEENKISVHSVYFVAGDVDFSTGNVDFVGSVQIRGGIKFGFTVRAEGDVEVGETVEGGSIIAGGNVVVRGGIRGQGKGKVVAGGSVFARFLEKADVQAGGDVVVGEAIMHSTVQAGGKISVSGKKGLIVGGLCRAGGDIEARIIGSNLATVTQLEVGVKPELRESHERVEKEIEKLEKQLDQVEKTLSFINKLLKAGRELPQEKRDLLQKLVQARKQILARIEELKLEEEELQEKLNTLEKGRVKVRDVVFPGVVVKIGQNVYYVRDQLHYVTFHLEEGEIKLSSYS